MKQNGKEYFWKRLNKILKVYPGPSVLQPASALGSGIWMRGMLLCPKSETAAIPLFSEQ